MAVAGELVGALEGASQDPAPATENSQTPGVLTQSSPVTLPLPCSVASIGTTVFGPASEAWAAPTVTRELPRERPLGMSCAS